MPLKAVLIAPHGTVYQNGQAQPNLLEELVLFIQRMQARGVHVGLWSRHPVTCTSHGRTERVETFLSRATGASVPFYQAASGDFPARRMKGSAGPILSRLGVKPQETILVGNEQEDMLAGLHNQLLLVRPGVVDRVAALYRERLEATGTAPTISAPTNSDAHRIGEAVRTQRRAMGLLGADLWSVRATDGERDFTLRLAAGDRVRLFKSTGAKYGQGRGGAIGRNGSVLEVVGADEHGITLRTKQGRIGTVEWDALPAKRGRVQLAYGYAMTIHTAQGSTTSEHISALPSGSRSIDGLQSYSALTRHRQKAFLITSNAAEQTEVRKRRAINDARPVTLDDKWAQVARVLSYQPEKDNAVSMFERVLAIRRGSVRAFHDVARRPSRSVGPDNALRQAHEHSLPDELRAMIRQAVAQVRHVAEQARTWRYEGPSLGR